MGEKALRQDFIGGLAIVAVAVLAWWLARKLPGGAGGGFLGAPEGMPRGRDYSEETAREIDRAVRSNIETAFDKATRLLTDRREVLDRGALKLLKKETLGEEYLRGLIASPSGARHPARARAAA